MDRDACRRLDEVDPVAHLRDRFEIPEGIIYLDGNSLGMLPKGVAARVADVVERQWGEDLIRSWNVHDWVNLPHRVGERIGRLIGARPGTVIACDSTTINLYKVVGAALEMAPSRVVLSDAGNFPTDLYVMAGLADVRIVDPDDVEQALEPGVGVVALTEVDYRTGRRHDMARITQVAHEVGAVMVWDLAHSAGAFEVELEGCDVDFAVGCGYKYLNGGPGAPGFLYVAPRHLDAFRNPILGWFGHVAPFEFRLDFTPAEGIGRARVGTSHVISLAALDAALDVFDDVDLRAIRAKSVSLTSVFIDLVDQRIPEVEVVSPRDPDRRGSQVSLRHPDGYPIMQALIDGGVIGDFRAPDIMRFGMAAACVRHVDVFDAVASIREILDDDRWRDPRWSRRSIVT